MPIKKQKQGRPARRNRHGRELKEFEKSCKKWQRIAESECGIPTYAFGNCCAEKNSAMGKWMKIQKGQ